MVGFLVVSGFFVLLFVLSALGRVADSREHSKFFAAPHERVGPYD